VVPLAVDLYLLKQDWKNSYSAYISEDGGSRAEEIGHDIMTVSVEHKDAVIERTKRIAALDKEDVAFDPELEVPEPEERKGWTLDDIVLYARPSKSPVENNMGPISAVPNLPGIPFPYFAGMIIPDKTFVRTIVSRHFKRLFGETIEDIKSSYVLFRQGID
jgi:hypothetical protein